MQTEKRAFGELEMAVMNVLWEIGPSTVQAVLDRLGGAQAYTTVMTVMGRLAQKGALTREKNGRNFVYSASREKPTEAATLLEKIRNTVFEGKAVSMVSYLIGNSGGLSENDLDAIQEMLDRRKLEMQEKGK